MALHLQDINDVDLYALLCESNTREDAFLEFYNRYKSRVYGYCRKVVGDAADDILQDTFIRFLTSAHSQREMNNVIGFLMTIARNLCLNYKELHSKPIVRLDDVNELELPMSVESIHGDEELKRAIEQALDLLGDDYREAVYMQLYSGMSYQEIAEAIGKPVSTVRNRVVRAKTKLRELLAPYFNELKQ